MSELRFTTAAIPDPGELLDLVPERDAALWLREGDGLVGWGEAWRIELGEDGERFERAAGAFEHFLQAGVVEDPVSLPGSGPVVFGSFTFDERRSGSVLYVPEVVVGRRGGRSWMTWSGDHRPVLERRARPAGLQRRIRYAGSSLEEVEWLEAVALAEKSCAAGEVTKVVLARDVHVWSKSALDPRELVGRLSTRFPQCFSFALDGLVGASPELLVRRIGDRVESVPLAGTCGRGTDAVTDERLGRGLLESDKDRREHAAAAASVRDMLSPLLDDLSIDDDPWLLKLANVQHLATRVAGSLRGEMSALDLAGRLHPTAAVCGVPRGDALELIRALERLDRARYGGPVGWMDARGDGEWAIALRCAEVDGTRARLFAGNGIVEGSVPSSELEETRLKLRAMQGALEPADAHRSSRRPRSIL
jgi:menaquinone-specific isochorismate synthase